MFVDLGFRSFNIDGDGFDLDVELLEAFLDVVVFLVLCLAFVLDLMLLRERVLPIVEYNISEIAANMTMNVGRRST